MQQELKSEKLVDLNDKILLNKKVVNINWKSGKVQIKCEDGSEFFADHVIVTLPHGVLKAQHQTLFTPSLPDAKVKSIEDIGFGTLGKVFLEFGERFFPSDIVSFTCLWSESDKNELIETDKAW